MSRRSERRERELEREIREHLDLEAEEQRAAGMPADEAHYAARRALGNTTSIKEASREMWGWTWVQRCFQDLRYGVRVLRKAPAFTGVAVLSLALGIGANTAVFSLLDAVLLKELPVRDPGSLRILTWVRNDQVPVHSHSGYLAGDLKTGLQVSGSFPYPAYLTFCQHLPQFSDLVAYAGHDLTVTADGTSDFAAGQFVSGNYFTGLGAQPLIGRPLLPEDEAPGRERAAVLTFTYWQKRFGGDPEIIGRPVVINQRPVTIAGVMPPAFQGLYPGRVTDVFLPLTSVEEIGVPWFSLSKPDNWWVQIFGRLKPGISDAEAAAAVRATLAGVIRDYEANAPEAAIPRVILAPGAPRCGSIPRLLVDAPVYSGRGLRVDPFDCVRESG